jgi:ferrous-iron efflux pump FieF
MSQLSDPAQTKMARTTVKVASGLCVVKLAAFAASGSSGVLGSAVDSGLDLVASLVVLWAVTAAARPADADHPFGHGKAESLASLLQSVLILASGLGLAYHAIHRALDDDFALQSSTLGIIIMIASSVVTLWLVRQLRRVAKETGSPALDADSAHYASDLATNLAAAAGLGLYAATGWVWPDLVVGLGIALVILNTAREVFTGATDGLMDKTMDSSEESAVLRTILGFSPRVAGFHDLRARRAGSEVFIELHLDIPRNCSFVEAHDLAEEVGEAVRRAVPRSHVTVHADPL